MPRIHIEPSDPAKDPSHPESKLPIRGPGDIVLRLIRKYGFSKGLRLFGYMMALATSNGVEGVLDKRARSECTMDIKACGLAPQDLKPRQLSGWTRKWFQSGFEMGYLARHTIDPIDPKGYTPEGEPSE